MSDSTRLPPILPTLLKQANATTNLKPVYDALEERSADARGGMADGTVLFMRDCLPDVAAWAVKRGTPIDATDADGRTALHVAAESPFARTTVAHLIKLGANAALRAPGGLTALHCACATRHHAAVQALLRHGVDANTACANRLTPLDHAIKGTVATRGKEILELGPVVDEMVSAGARWTDTSRAELTRVASEFESGRDAIPPTIRDMTWVELPRLCGLAGIRMNSRKHDGKSRISVPDGPWKTRYEALWDHLVPDQGRCKTVQAEVIRIAGRIHGEMTRNAGGNWDADFDRMGAAFVTHLATAEGLERSRIERARALLAGLPHALVGTELLAELATEWVTSNPDPIRSRKPDYAR